MDVIRGFRRLALRFFPVHVTPKVSSYEAAVNYELGVIAAKVDRPYQARASSGTGCSSASSPARRASGSTVPRRRRS